MLPKTHSLVNSGAFLIAERMDKDRETGRFVTGNIGGGRPKGSRNKLGEAFISALHDDFIQNGETVIQEVRATKPDQYLKVIASILPKQFELDGNLLTKFSDEQLGQLVAALDAWVQANGDTGTPAPEGREQVNPLSPVH